MNTLLNFGDIQLKVEFLSAIIYFTSSIYLLFLLFLKRFLPLKEKNILRALSYGFLAIAIIFVVRQSGQISILEFAFYETDLSVVLFMMTLILPCQYYFSEIFESSVFSLKHYILNLVFLVASYIIVQLSLNKSIMVSGEISEIYLYIAISVFFIYSSYLIYRFFQNIKAFSKEEGLSMLIYRNDIFIFASITVFSIMLLLFVLFEVKYIYSRIVIMILSITNALMFVKITLSYSAKGLLKGTNENDCLTNLKEERHKMNRQLSDNIKADELYGRLIKYFEKEKPYLRQDLKINEVALYLYSNKTYLSRIINDKNNQNFNQFVNYYRVEEVKNLFTVNDKLNIQELCYMSGFGSMATFSIAFRFQLGYTPADWCKDQKLRVRND